MNFHCATIVAKDKKEFNPVTYKTDYGTEERDSVIVVNQMVNKSVKIESTPSNAS